MVSKLLVKKALTIVMTLAIVFVYSFSGIQKAGAWSTLDQFTVNANGYWWIQTHQIVGQSFRPTYNKLDGVGVYAGILPTGPDGCILTVKIYDATVLPPVLIGQTTMPIPKAETYNIADIGPLDVTPEARYEMHVFSNSSYAYWLVNGSNVYSRGLAIIDSTPDITQDFVFATFGYNDTPPEESSPAPEAEVDPDLSGGDVAADTAAGEAPASASSSNSPSTTSTSISAPTGLTAEVAAEGTSSTINLSWTASKTSGITGYSVLRSTSEKSGFVEIGATDAKTLTFRDDKAVNDQTYYYVVRAYKDGTISKNSNVASAKITDVTAPAAPANFQIVSQNEEEINFTWDAPIDTDLSNYILTIANSSEDNAEVLETIETIGKDETGYSLKLAEHEKLAIDTEYTFYLQAKDVSNNFSEKAETSGQFAAEVQVTIWTWVGLVAAVLALAGAIIFLIIRRRKNRSISA